MPPQAEDKFYSSLGLKVHRSRGDYFRGTSGDLWLEEKSEFDGAENLWRIHDDLYDFSDFVDKHPGGPMWLKVTKGTDITEAFESHHVGLGPGNLLSKFQIRKATTPRNSPFTFEEDGFYRTLKKHIRDALKSVPASAPRQTKIIIDTLLVGYIFFAILSAKYWCFGAGILSAVCLCFLTVAAHNFFHQKDNFRMYYFDLSCVSSREWRISHVLSHHLYTNTIIDLEIQFCEPFLQFLPTKKSWINRYGSWIYSPLFYLSLFPVTYIKRIVFLIETILNGKKDNIDKEIVLPLLVPVVMYIFSGQNLGNVLLMWSFIVCIASTQFGLIGLNAAHHRPEIFHDGDTTRGKTIDWGISQLDAVIDRYDITGSLFLVLTNFGDHGLHHMFPTLDHAKLDYLYPTFEKVCNMFGVELRMKSQIDMIKNTFLQLSRVEPNPLSPGHKSNKDK